MMRPKGYVEGVNLNEESEAVNCFECDCLLDNKEVLNGRVYKHDRYSGKRKPLCKYCRKTDAVTGMSDQLARDLDRKWRNEVYEENDD